MANYFDKIQYLYPNIQNVMYWHAQYDGTEWDDPYDGIIWENTEIEKPSKAKLDALREDLVEMELAKRHQQQSQEQFAKNNPVFHLEGKILDLQQQINQIYKNMSDFENRMEGAILTIQNHNSESVDAIKAIKGFLMEIPNISKELAQIQSALKKPSDVS